MSAPIRTNMLFIRHVNGQMKTPSRLVSPGGVF